MTDKKTLQGGVIVSPEQHTHAVIQLLTYQLQRRMQLSYYSHPNEIEGPHNFLIVLSAADLEGAIKVFRTRQQTVPFIIHIDEPEKLDRINYATLFPGVEIAAIPHVPPGRGQDVTLRLDLFRTVIELLEARM